MNFTDILRTQSEKDIAFHFYSLNKENFIYDSENYHWYEYNGKTYQNMKFFPYKLNISLSTSYLHILHGKILEIDTEIFKLKEKIHDGCEDSFSKKELIYNKQKDISRIESVIKKIGKESFVQSIISKLKYLYYRPLSKEKFKKLTETTCSVEQWIYLNIFEESNDNRMTCNDILEIFHRSQNSTITDVYTFGKKIQKCLQKKSKISGNRRYYDNITIFKDSI